MRRMGFSLLCLTLCAAAPPARQEERALELAVTLRARTQCRAEREDGVLPGATLHSGDCMMLRLGTSQPAYLYVLLASPESEPVMLFPAGGDVQVAPQQPLRLPAGDRWFRLDEHAGEEHLAIIAAAGPLARSDPRVAGLLRKSSARGAEGQPLPLMVDVHTKGLGEVDAKGGTVYARATGKGAAVFRITLRHAP